jgi:hypothetical protein
MHAPAKGGTRKGLTDQLQAQGIVGRCAEALLAADRVAVHGGAGEAGDVELRGHPLGENPAHAGGELHRLGAEGRRSGEEGLTLTSARSANPRILTSRIFARA